jgi:hypothetical protein
MDPERDDTATGATLPLRERLARSLALKHAHRPGAKAPAPTPDGGWHDLADSERAAYLRQADEVIAMVLTEYGVGHGAPVADFRTVRPMRRF